MKNPLQQIRTLYSELNKREKLVADYIMSHPREAIHLSITEFARKAKVSETTVFRFANHLGYAGFSAFKVALIACTVSPSENIYDDLNAENNTQLLMQKLMHGYELSLQETIQSNAAEKLEHVCAKIRSAQKVYFFGMGGSYPLALDAQHKLIRNGVSGFATADVHWQTMYVQLADQTDVLMLISSSGSNRDLFEVARLAREKGLFIVTLTSDASSPLGKIADIALVAHGREYNTRQEALESRISTLLLIDTLYLMLSTLSQEQQNRTLENIKSIRDGISEHRL